LFFDLGAKYLSIKSDTLFSADSEGHLW